MCNSHCGVRPCASLLLCSKFHLLLQTQRSIFCYTVETSTHPCSLCSLFLTPAHKGRCFSQCSFCNSHCQPVLELLHFVPAAKKCCMLAKIPQEVLAACSSYYPRINRGNVNIVFEDLVSKDSWFKRFSSPRWNILLC